MGFKYLSKVFGALALYCKDSGEGDRFRIMVFVEAFWPS